VIHHIFAVLDRAADAFGRPIFVNALGQAIRQFQDEIQRAEPNNALNLHPEDFDLYHLGTYDDNTGKLISLDEPKQIAIGKHYKKE